MQNNQRQQTDLWIHDTNYSGKLHSNTETVTHQSCHNTEDKNHAGVK